MGLKDCPLVIRLWDISICFLNSEFTNSIVLSLTVYNDYIASTYSAPPSATAYQSTPLRDSDATTAPEHSDAPPYEWDDYNVCLLYVLFLLCAN